VLVTGCAADRLMAIAVAKACGSSTVFATETKRKNGARWPRKWSRRGAEPATEDAVGRILAETNGTGVDALLRNAAGILRRFSRIQSAASGGARFAAGDSNGEWPLDLRERRDFKAATCREFTGGECMRPGADDSTAEGGAAESGALLESGPHWTNLKTPSSCCKVDWRENSAVPNAFRR